ncbi:beta-propeller fold lactonase family protein [Streptomyces palmae]|uniref:YncE family protein n=1 Tax=Streptomyces palmae TaxID=1701085 RepID=A0A4Z0H9Z0_9ACTN|nr:beta-propeller fold lactonase family protein [Streptomyces palmae]TGB10025.1 hypothetical protein E4099_13160 [Streptomyces palmae]
MPAQDKSASTSVALCVDWANDTLTVIDTSAPTTQPLPISQVLGTGSGPRTLAIGPGGTRVYVPNWGAATLSVFTRENGTTSLLTTSAVGANPCAVLAGLAHEQVCVANRGGDSVTVLTVDGGTPANCRLGTGTLPHALAGSPDGARVLVANWGTGSVSLIDVSAATDPTLLDPPLKLKGSPRVLAAHPSRPVGYAAVWNAADGGETGTVYAIDLSGSQPTALEPTVAVVDAQPRAMAVTADGCSLYVANYGSGSGHGSVGILPLRPDTGALTGALRMAGVVPNPVAVAVPPGGTDCYVVSQTAGTVAACDTSGSTLMILPVGRAPAGLAAAGGYLYITDNGTGKLTTVRTMPVESRKLDARTGARPVNVAVSPDGECVYTADSGATTVSVLPTNAASGTTIELPAGNKPWGVAIAANGSLACATAPDTNRLFILRKGTNGICDATGITPEPIDLGAGTAPRGVAITPDSRYAVTANAANGTVSLVGLGPQTITNEDIKASEPVGLAVSEDESHLYVSDFASSGASHISVLHHEPLKGTWSHSMKITGDHLFGSEGLAIADGGDKGPCLYVAGRSESNLVVLRKRVSGTWAEEYTVDKEAGKFNSPWGLALAHKRRLLFVANSPIGTSEPITISVFAVQPDASHSPGDNQNPRYYGSISLPYAPYPMGLGISADEKYLYLATHSGDSFKKIYAMKLRDEINETTKEYLEASDEISHSALNSPTGLACSASGEQLYVANRGVRPQGGQAYQGGGVYVLTLGEDRLTLNGDPRLLLSDTAGTPYSVAVAAGRVYVAHRESKKISVLDQSIRHIPCTGPGHSVYEPWDVACTADGSYAYVADRKSPCVHDVDLPAQKLVGWIATPSRGVPTGVVCAPSGVRVYVVESGKVTVLQRQVQPAAAGWKATLAEASMGVALHPSRPLLYVACKSKLHPLATEWNASGTVLDVGSDLRGVAIHPDGTHGYLVDGTEGGATTAAIRVVGLTDPGSPTDTGSVSYLPAGVEPTAAAIHQAGSHTVLYVAGRSKEKGGVWAYSVADDHITLTVQTSLDDLGKTCGLAVRASPGQAYLYLITEEQDGSRLHVLDLSSPTSPASTGTTVLRPDKVRDLTIHPRGWYGYATTTFGSVLVFDMGNPLRPRQAGQPKSVADGAPGGVALGPTGRAYLAQDTEVRQLVLGPPGPADARDQYALAGSPQAVEISGNGENLFVTTAEAPGRLTVLDAWTGQLRGHIKAGTELAGMALAPDGQHLYAADSGGSAVSVVDTPLDTMIGTTEVGLDPRQVICT